MHQSSPTVPRPKPGETFSRRRRIGARRDFTATYADGRRHAGRLVVVFARPRDGEGRLGVTATRKTGNAVARNRARRRVREIYRRWRARAPLATGLDVVVNVTARTAGAAYAALEVELSSLLDRAAAAAFPERA